MLGSAPNAANTRALVRLASGGPDPARRGCAGSSPTATSAAAAGRAPAPAPAGDVAGGQRVEHVLVHLEVEDHVHPVAVGAEVLQRPRRARRSPRPAGSRRPCATAGTRAGRSSSRSRSVAGLVPAPLALDDEGDGVDAKAGDAQLQPEAHDLADLFLDRRVRDVEVGLELVEAVKVVGARLVVVGPGRSSGRRGRPCPRWRRAASSSTRCSSRGSATSGRARAAWNHGCWSDVWLITRSMMTRMPRSRACCVELDEVARGCRSRGSTP